MKKHSKIIFSAIVALFISFAAYAQSDSTNVTPQVHEQLNKAVETIFLPAIFSLLGATGVNLTPFAALITFVVMFIIRRAEKRHLKGKVAKELRDVINTSDDPNTPETLAPEHRSKLRRLLDKLEKTKTTDEH